MNIGDRIKEVREDRKKTLLDVANHIGVTEATVQRYESGNIKNLKLDTISKIASYLNVDPAYLMGWKNTKEDLMTKSEYNYIPTSISAGLPIEVDGILEGDAETISIPDYLMGKWAGNSQIFFTRTNGDSMNRIIPHDSLIAVKPIESHELKDNDIVVYRKHGEYAVKRFIRDNDRLIFKPDSNDNRFADDVVYLDDIGDLAIKGKVVMWIVTTD